MSVHRVSQAVHRTSQASLREVKLDFKDLDIDLMANQFGETGFDYLSEGTREKLKEKFPELVPDE